MPSHALAFRIVAAFLLVALQQIPVEAAGQASLDTFVTPAGEGYFALKLVPGVAQPTRRPHDVVLLFDTSASQVGAYRAKALAALESLLAGLDPQDRVQLIAVDVVAVPLTTAFVAPTGSDIESALSDLRRRVPLGSTDMPAALEAALAAYRKTDAADHERATIYLGDGLSPTDLIAPEAMRIWADRFTAARVPVTSLAIGPRYDLLLLGALAKTTGGALAIDDDERISGRELGRQLADMADSAVIWPERLQLPKTYRAVYYRGSPPMRFDRDTVILGTFTPSKEPPSALPVEISGDLAGQPVKLDFDATPAKPNDDHAYLQELVQFARVDGGVSLPTIGSLALDTMRRLLNERTRQLVKLGQQAVVTGDLDNAQRLADAAARLNPADAGALTIRRAVARVASTAAQATRKDSQPPPQTKGDNDPPGREAADSDLLNEVERQQRVVEGFLRAEVRNVLSRARAQIASDPQGASDMLKLVMEKVRQTPELSPDVRAQLVDQLEAALRTASRQSTLKEQIDLQREQVAAEGEARERINRELFLQEQKVDQLMSRFNALMDEGRYRDAEALADIAEEMLPGRAGLRGAELTARMLGYNADMTAVLDMRRKGFVDATFQIELSHVPTADEPPIIYPDPEVWQLLTERRKKYKAVDVKENKPSEQKIYAALDEPTEIDFAEQPLSDVVEYLKQRHGIEIQLDDKALADAGAATDTPITRSIKGITLRSALKLLLSDLDLTYVIRNEVLMITSKTEAENMLVTKVYPVGDLVVPIQNPIMGRGRF